MAEPPKPKPGTVVFPAEKGDVKAKVPVTTASTDKFSWKDYNPGAKDENERGERYVYLIKENNRHYVVTLGRKTQYKKTTNKPWHLWPEEWQAMDPAKQKAEREKRNSS